jgi:hypothetical protein
MPPENIREIVERVKSGDRGIDDLIAVLALTQGNLDPTSFMLGLMAGKGGGGMDRSAIMMLLATSFNSANVNTQQTTTGAVVNPMQQMLPLLLLLGRDDWDGREKTIEFIEKKAGGAAGGR